MMTDTTIMATHRHHHQTMRLTAITQDQDTTHLTQVQGITAQMLDHRMEVRGTTHPLQVLLENHDLVMTMVQEPQERNIHPGHAVPTVPTTGAINEPPLIHGGKAV
jgi:hypothetical protein